MIKSLEYFQCVELFSSGSLWSEFMSENIICDVYNLDHTACLTISQILIYWPKNFLRNFCKHRGRHTSQGIQWCHLLIKICSLSFCSSVSYLSFHPVQDSLSVTLQGGQTNDTSVKDLSLIISGSQNFLHGLHCIHFVGVVKGIYNVSCSCQVCQALIG